ncbi:hypothetical protein SANTM175S_05915 [Streptomyces antimycoticus]
MDTGEFGMASAERGQVGRELRRPDHRGGRRRRRDRLDRLGGGRGRPGHHLAMGGAQFTAGRDAELIGQPVARGREDLQRLGPPSGGGEHPDQLGLQGLVQRMVGGELLEHGGQLLRDFGGQRRRGGLLGDGQKFPVDTREDGMGLDIGGDSVAVGPCHRASACEKSSAARSGSPAAAVRRAVSLSSRNRSRSSASASAFSR